MGGCVSTSSKSTCSSWSNGDNKPVPRPYLGIRCCVSKRAKRTFSDHILSLQNLASIPNRIITSGKSRSSCIFTQQGRKGINQDAMIVWEDFMSEDVTFCGVFDGHGPFGHLVARKVRDTLPVKLQSFFHTLQSKQNGRFRRSSSKSAVQEAVNKERTDEEDKLKGLWGEAFLKSYKAMDKELRSHPNVDCFCSGSTAVTILKQGSNLFMGNIGDSRAILGSKDSSNDTMIWDVLSNEEVVDIVAAASSRASAARILVNSAAREWKLKYPTSKMDDCAVVCLFLDGKMDSESDYDEQGFSSATNAVESDDGQRSEPCLLQRNFTVRSSSDQENETCGNNVNTDDNTEAEDERGVGDQNWLGLEGVTRVNSLVQLPRFSAEMSKT
ncbi:putative protein phosphatase 2C 52 [Raphanus sativus]|nr:putative protein phosphatase 2C 52 [Raphanus sativus]